MYIVRFLRYSYYISNLVANTMQIVHVMLKQRNTYRDVHKDKARELEHCEHDIYRRNLNDQV